MRTSALITGGIGDMGFGTAQKLAGWKFDLAIFDLVPASKAEDRLGRLRAQA